MGNIEKETQKRPLWEALVNGGATSDSAFAPAFQYKTVTPTKSQQIIEADAGFNGLGQVTVEKIPEEYIYTSGVLSVSQNGVFPVEQFQSLMFTVEGDEENAIIERKLSAYENSRVSIIGSGFYAIDYDSTDPPTSGLERASFPNATVVGDKAFHNCLFLSDIYIPNCESIGNHAFGPCNFSEVSFPKTVRIGEYAFAMCAKLKSADFPNVSYLGRTAFWGCSELTTANFPQLEAIPSGAFNECRKLIETSFAKASVLMSAGFSECTALSTICFPALYSIESNAFSQCYNLVSLYLLGSSVCYLQNKNAFYSTPISDYTASTGGVHGSVFVPSSLYDTYISAYNWSLYAARIVSMTDEEIAALG